MPSNRRSSESAISALVALAGTAALFGSVLFGNAGRLLFVDEPPAPEARVAEALTFVEPEPPSTPPSRSAAPTAARPATALLIPSPRLPGHAGGVAAVDSSATGGERERDPAGRGDRRPAPDEPKPCVGPCGDGRIAYHPDRGPLTAAQRDSVLAMLQAGFLERAARVTLSREEQDALYRARGIEESHAANVALGAPPPVKISGPSIPVPLPFGGPSAEERRRNAIIHADNRARLARLALRADSTRAFAEECGDDPLDELRQRTVSDSLAGRTDCGHARFRE